MSGRLRAACEDCSPHRRLLHSSVRCSLFFSSRITECSGDTVPKPDHIFDLERRQQVLEEEIARALLNCSPDDPMVGDLRRRMLHLREELERFCNKAIADRRLH
jgi:hypothetical protein